MHFQSREKPSTCARQSFCGHIVPCSIERRPHVNPWHDGPGLSPDEPIAIVQTAIVQTAIVQTAIVRVESPSIPDGRYYIKNGAADFFWNCGGDNPITVVYFYSGALRDHVFLPVKSILQLFNCSKDNSLFWSGTSHMILMVTSS